VLETAGVLARQGGRPLLLEIEAPAAKAAAARALFEEWVSAVFSSP
jgi:hypothetical protein